jgi:replicative DNA helicase
MSEEHGLPRATQAEVQILGTFLRFGELVKVTRLDRADFYSERHRTIFEAMQSLASENSFVDVATVAERLRRSRKLDIAGGVTTLMDLADSVVSPAGWEEWQKLVQQKATLRHGIELARRLNERMTADDQDPQEVIAELANAVSELSRRSAVGEMTSWQQAFRQATGPRDATPNVPTGIPFLDRILQVRPGQLGIIAGRPGDGKSALASQIVVSVAQQAETLLCTLEMAPEEVAQRMVAQLTGVELSELDRRSYGRDGRDRVRAQENALDLQFCQTTTVADLRALALTRKAQGRLRLVVVDYLQLMRVRKPSASRNEDVASISRDLKLLAGELQVPIIALSQFSRDAAKGPPEVHHLRDSGAIEQDADWILFVYTERGQEGWTKMVRLAKNRRGQVTPPFAVEFHGPTVSFRRETL